MRICILLFCAFSVSFAHASILNKCGAVFTPRKPTPHQLMVQAWDQAARVDPVVREIREKLRRTEIEDGLEAVHDTMIPLWRTRLSPATFMTVSQLLLRFEMIPGQHPLIKDGSALIWKIQSFAMFQDFSRREVKALLALVQARLPRPWPEHILRVGWGSHSLNVTDVHDTLDLQTATAETFALHFERRMIHALATQYERHPDQQLLTWVNIVKESFADSFAGGSQMSGSEFAKTIEWLIHNDDTYNHQTYPKSALAARQFTTLFKTKFLGVTLREIADSVAMSYNDKFKIRRALTEYAQRLEQTREFANHNPGLHGLGTWPDGIQTLDIWEPHELDELHQFWKTSQTKLSDKLNLLIDDLMAPRWGK